MGISLIDKFMYFSLEFLPLRPSLVFIGVCFTKKLLTIIFQVIFHVIVMRCASILRENPQPPDNDLLD